MTNTARLQLYQMADELNTGLSPKTVSGREGMLRKWVRFCQGRKLKDWRECDYEFVNAWMDYLEKQGLSGSSVRNIAPFPLRCIELLQRAYPESVSDKFCIPYSRIPSQEFGYRKDVLRDVEMRAILRAAISDIESTTVWNRAAMVPFVVLFVLETGMNVSPALSLRRDCLEEDDEGGYWLLWGKPRAGRVMRDYYLPATWGPVEIVRAIKGWHEGQQLFSYPGMTGEIPVISDLLRAWCERHSLPIFTLRELRPARASMLYRDSGGDILLVQNYLHHRSPNTTLLYLAETVIKPMHRYEVAGAQEKMFAEWGVGEDSV